MRSLWIAATKSNRKRAEFCLVAAIAIAVASGSRAAAAEVGGVPERDAGWLKHTYYDRRLLPEPILQENNRRHARYLAELATREQERLAAYRAWTTDPSTSADTAANAVSLNRGRLREQLIDSLGVHGPSTSFELRDARSWRWMAPIRTNLVEVEGVRVPRNSPQRKGHFQDVALASPIGNVTALLARGREAKPPYPVVVCLPDIDPHTGLTGRKENLVGAPQLQQLIEAGFLVVAADLPALSDLREVAVKQAFLLGEPPVGRMAAQLSVLVSYLRTRDDVKGDRIAVYGRGLGGFVAALGAAVDTRIWATVVEDGLRSYRRIAEQGAELDLPWLVPRMLAYADAPDLVALIAPRPLLVVENGATMPGVEQCRTSAGRGRHLVCVSRCGGELSRRGGGGAAGGVAGDRICATASGRTGPAVGT